MAVACTAVNGSIPGRGKWPWLILLPSDGCIVVLLDVDGGKIPLPSVAIHPAWTKCLFFASHYARSLPRDLSVHLSADP